MADLTAQERSEIRSDAFELWLDGQSQSEMRESMRGTIEGLGLELPEHGGLGFFPLPVGPGGSLEDVTREQRREIRANLVTMWTRGEDPKEIAESIRDLVEGYEYEVPDRPMNRFPGHDGPGGRGFKDELTEEQREEIHRRVEEMHRNDVAPEEIHEAVRGMMESFGVELQEEPWEEGRSPFHGVPPVPFDELSESQREGLCRRIGEMMLEDASHEEIHEELRRKLEEFGIDRPERPNRGMRGRGLPLGGEHLMTDLSDAQRASVRGAILDLWLAGATHPEIRSQVKEILEDLGVDLAGDSDDEISSMRAEEGTSSVSDVSTQGFTNVIRSSGEIHYALSEPGEVRVEVYNASGQLVRDYEPGFQETGTHSVLWDGRDLSGSSVKTGVYLCRIQAGQNAETHRILYIH
jgi:hypothetical protein